MKMFCFQCQETLNNQACVTEGICGKTHQVARLQDLLIYILKGISIYAVRAKELDVSNEEVDIFVAEALFSTITNVNFDPQRMVKLIKRAFRFRDKARDIFLNAYKEKYTNRDFTEELCAATSWRSDGDIDDFIKKGEEVGILLQQDEDIRSLRELLVYGLKGIAAYADHAYILGQRNSDIFAFLHEGLAATMDDTLGVEGLVNLVLKTGEYAVKAMELLDKAHTSCYGQPEITEVYTATKKGPAILVSGHDLLDLEEILKQTQDTGINVYTHGEMLAANAYPGFKKYKHLIGNYGTSWHNQQKEFAAFGGVIVMTTNCLQKPMDSYKDRLFTTGLVGWPGVKHIHNRTGNTPKDFTAVIEKALALGDIEEAVGRKITIGFAHEAVLNIADRIIAAIKSGAIRRFIVMAGCDGRYKERKYFTQVAKELPADTIILTAGCAKYRYNMLELGEINGIPRVIDAGQCNDSYSLILIALRLKEAFGLKDINELPISFDIAWYEQKAVAVLLALLFLGVKGIILGPSLPAFISGAVLKVLVNKFAIKKVFSVDQDITAMMEGKKDYEAESLLV
jgi:hydroxylamine reductase